MRDFVFKTVISGRPWRKQEEGEATAREGGGGRERKGGTEGVTEEGRRE